MNENPYASPGSSVTSQATRPRSKLSMLFAAAAIPFAGIPFAFAVFGTIMGRGLLKFILDNGFLAALSGISILSGLSLLWMQRWPWLYFLCSFVLAGALLVATILLLSSKTH